MIGLLLMLHKDIIGYNFGQKKILLIIISPTLLNVSILQQHPHHQPRVSQAE